MNLAVALGKLNLLLENTGGALKTEEKTYFPISLVSEYGDPFFLPPVITHREAHDGSPLGVHYLWS